MYSITKKYFIVFALNICSLTIVAQEELGFVNSNYAGVNSLFINPSFNVDSKIFIDVHLIGFDAFLHNNVTYFPKPDFSPIRKSYPDALINESERNKKAFGKIDLIGPSVGVSWGKHSFGLFTRFRTFLDAKMTKSLFVLAIKKFKYQPYLGKSFDEYSYANTISWFETGLSYGYMHMRSSFETIDFGINVKRLVGYNSSSVAISKFDFVYNGERDILINEAEGGYRITNPQWGVGKGWGVDIGVNYQKKLESVVGYKPNTKDGGCKYIDYKLKLGFSILDLGAFRVKNNAVVQEFQYIAQPFVFDSTKTKSFKDIDQWINVSLINNNVNQTRRTNYRALLPFALSLQFDYNFENNFYLNVTTVNAFKIANQTRRVDVLAITPRYERKYFEVDVPIALVDFRYPQVGLAFRFGNNLIIGTERLDSFIGRIRNVYGGDLYFHLKFAIYKKCRGKSNYKSAGSKNKSVKHCDAYN